MASLEATHDYDGRSLAKSTRENRSASATNELLGIRRRRCSLTKNSALSFSFIDSASQRPENKQRTRPAISVP